MSHAKRVSTRKRGGKAMPALGAAGFLALASGASAEAPLRTSTPNTGVSRQVFLGEEEISEVSLATFYVFDTENVGSRKPGVQLARGGGGCGGCGGGGCRGCGGCGGGCARGCGGGCRVRLRLWRLRWLWLRRVRPGLVGCLRYRVCRRYRCSLLHILGRLPLLLRPAPHSALSRQGRLHAAVIPHPLNRHYERIDSGPACGARALPHGECDY